MQMRGFCCKLLSVGIDQSYSSRGTKIIGLAMPLFIVLGVWNTNKACVA